MFKFDELELDYDKIKNYGIKELYKYEYLQGNNHLELYFINKEQVKNFLSYITQSYLSFLEKKVFEHRIIKETIDLKTKRKLIARYRLYNPKIEKKELSVTIRYNKLIGDIIEIIEITHPEIKEINIPYQPEYIEKIENTIAKSVRLYDIVDNFFCIIKEKVWEEYPKKYPVTFYSDLQPSEEVFHISVEKIV